MEGQNAGELLSDADHAERIKLRDIYHKARVRRRLRCKRCCKTIPEDKRVDALYCSDRCQRKYRWEQITTLRTEMRAEYRTLTAPKVCECGEPLNNRPGRKGKVARSCQWCRWAAKERAKRRRIREQKAAFCGPVMPRVRVPRKVRPDVHTHCPHGHEYAIAGYYIRKKGGKHCKQCLRDYEKRRPRKAV